MLSPDFSGAAEVDAIQITGEWLSDKNTVTLPFTPEPNYGFTIGYILNVDGSAEVEKGSEDWYDAVIVKEGTIRIRTLKENLGEDRTASFAVNAGGATCNVKVIQQGLAGVKTIKFGNLEWMDRRSAPRSGPRRPLPTTYAASGTFTSGAARYRSPQQAT